MISVDGDMSTNDAVYAFAPAREADEAPPGFCAALRARRAATSRSRWSATARARPRRSPFDVTGARDAAQARAIARAIVNSNLVKTALYGEDPNWGRIIAAAGAARSGLDPEAWSLYLNGSSVGRARRGRGAVGGGGAPRTRRHGRGGAARPRHRRRDGDRVGLRPLARLRAHQRALPHVSATWLAHARRGIRTCSRITAARRDHVRARRGLLS